MKTNLRPPYVSWGRTAWYGAEIALALTFVYTLAFIIYACIRATITILATPDIDAGLVQTLFATWVGLVLPSLVFAAFCAVLAVPFGVITALVMRALLGALHIGSRPGQAALAGGVFCLIVSLALFGLLNRTLGVAWSPTSAESMLVWLILPLLVYIAAGGVASRRLSRYLGSSGAVSPKEYSYEKRA